MFYVIYGKIVEDKDNGVQLAGVYFGGVADDLHAAETVARDCVNSVKGGSILPKIFERNGDGQLLPAIADATIKFRALEQQMVMSENIITRSNRRPR